MHPTYILQDLYLLPLGYRFSLYTYGPHTLEVLAAIKSAEVKGHITLDRAKQPGDPTSIGAGPSAIPYLQSNRSAEPFQPSIDHLAQSFAGLTPKSTSIAAKIAFLRRQNDLLDPSARETMLDTIQALNPYTSKEQFLTSAKHLMEVLLTIDNIPA